MEADIGLLRILGVQTGVKKDMSELLIKQELAFAVSTPVLNMLPLTEHHYRLFL